MMHSRSRYSLKMLGEPRGYLLGVGLVLCIVAAAVVFLPQPKANAFPGRQPYYGYFANQYDPDGNKAISNNNNGLNNVTNAAEFINTINFDLNSAPGNDQTGAAFIILDMLSVSPGAEPIQTANDMFDEWSNVITYSAAAGKINFNQNFYYTINTYWQNSVNLPAGDIAWYADSGTFPAIVIYWGDGSHYAIKKNCGNPVGDNNTKGIPNYLKVKHVDENGTEMVSSSSNFINKIVCSADIFGNCTASRGGSSYTIELASGNYTVTNTGVPLGYEYTGYTLTLADGRVVTNTNSAVTSLNFDTIPQKPFTNIIWRYKKTLGNNCSPIAQTVGIGETATLKSTIATGNTWTAGFGTPNSGSLQSFSVSYGAVGNFPVTLTVNGTTSTCYVVVTQKPYIRAYGGDIFAGSSSGCYGEGWKLYGGNAGIYGFVGTTAGTGSGAQLGVLAMGPVWGFNSAMLRTGATAPLPPSGLTFGNESPLLGKVEGMHCPYDYWGKKVNNPTAALNALDIIDPALNNLSGNLYIKAPAATNTIYITTTNIQNSRIINLFVEGNLVIQNNIIYAGAGSWRSADVIPRLQIVVRGNIFIDKSVTQLDGVYVAQGGTIYTCTNGAGGVVNGLYADCNTQLTVNGALVASRIKWLRTFGHLGNSTFGENPNSNSNCTSLGVTYTKPTCASEIVNLGPEAWMVEQSSTNPNADYIQALPPLL